MAVRLTKLSELFSDRLVKFIKESRAAFQSSLVEPW